MLTTELNHLAGLGYTQLRQRAAARDHIALAGELAGPVRDNDRFGAAGAGRPDHLNLTAHHDEHGNELRPDLDEHIAAGRCAPPPVRLDPVELRRRQRWKQAVGQR